MQLAHHPHGVLGGRLGPRPATGLHDRLHNRREHGLRHLVEELQQSAKLRAGIELHVQRFLRVHLTLQRQPKFVVAHDLHEKRGRKQRKVGVYW